MDLLLQSRRASLLSSLVSQNQTLRVCLGASGIVSLALIIGIIALALRKPLVIGLDRKEPVALDLVEDPAIFTLPEIKAFIYELISKKFPKNPTKENLMAVCRYFTEGPRTSCEKELQPKKTFIPQEVLIEEVYWNEQTEAASVRLKRFATFNGTVSAVENSLTLKIVKRSRTSENPWGIFVESWKEEIGK